MEARTHLQKRRLVRFGYRILLRAEAELELLTDRPRITAHCIALADACLDWIAEVHGGILQRRAEEMGEAQEKAATYLLRLRIAWEDGEHAALVYESHLREEGRSSKRRLSEIWCLSEETVLGKSEILRRWGKKSLQGKPSFPPENAYPQGEGTVFYRNRPDGAAWEEEFLFSKGEQTS